MSEHTTPIRFVNRKQVRISEESSRRKILPDKVHERLKVILFNMEGEKDPSLHEPISIEVLASRVLDKFPNVELIVHDTQPELVHFGKINTDGLAAMARQFGNDKGIPMLLGISVPIYSYSYTKSLLLKLETHPPVSPTSIVLGNAIPTYTNPSLILKDFPSITLVKGEGDEVILEIAQMVATYRPLERIYEQKPDLNRYQTPYRDRITADIMALGGSVKVETSRGCDFGDCTFCSRCERGGKDYRTVPEQKVVDTIRELVQRYNVYRFELTDEEAFANVDDTRKLVSALQAANLPKIHFSASLRVDLLNGIEDAGLLSPLMELGLDKVFLGIEGGSDDYLKLMAKGQTMAEARRAIEIAKTKNLYYEIGFIMFSWRMSLKMLQDNIAFVSEGDNLFHISSIFNNLEVRAGTIDEKFLKPYNENGKISYDSDAGFSVNDSTYKNVPFLDKEVERIYDIVRRYEHSEANLHYAVKSYKRSGMAQGEVADIVDKFYTELVQLRLMFMRNVSGLEAKTDYKRIVEKRRSLVEGLDKFMNDEKNKISGAGEIVKREAKIFLAEEPEIAPTRIVHKGAMIVAMDQDDRVLLVRPRLDERWSFPGGGIKDGELPIEAAIRESKEELGHDAEMKVLGNLKPYVSERHLDHASLNTERLELQHFAVRVNADSVNIFNADHEIVDVLWAKQQDILSGKIEVMENVYLIVGKMRSMTYINLYRSGK